MIGIDHAEEATDRIIDLLYGRSGFDHWWDDIDEFQSEIRSEITEVIREECNLP